MSKKQHQEDLSFDQFIFDVMWIFAFIIIILPIFKSCHNSYAYEKISNVTATVIDKEYIENDSYYMIGSTIGIDKEEEYLLTLKYDEICTIIDNQTLYNTLDIGSTINVDLYVYHDKNGNITSKELVLKEE